MVSDGRPIADGFAIRTSFFYAVSCALLGIHMPFFPVWLEAVGFNAGQVGAILASGALVRVISVPAATQLADGRLGLRSAIIAFAAATALGFSLLGLVERIWLLVALVVFTAFTHTPAVPLLDAYALRGLRARGKAYGPVRLWGSASFIMANVGAGLAFDLISPHDLIWLIAACAVAIALTSFLLLPLPPQRPAGEQAEPKRPLWRNPAFIGMVMAASLVQSSHAVYYGFSTIGWTAAGLDGIAIGALWALGVIAEIILFALSGRLPPSIGPFQLLMLGAAGGVVRWTVMAFDPPSWSLPLLQCLHGLTFGASHLAAIGFIAQAAPEGRGATAQGYFSVLQGITFSACMLLGGFLYARIGSFAYGAMAATSLLGGLIVATIWIRTPGRGVSR